MPLPNLFCSQTKIASFKRERRKDARPGELLAAALALFVAKGFAGTRAEEVAQIAGVSKGTLFLYFSSKEELFKAVVRDNISSHYPHWHSELETFTGSTADMLRVCVQRWWTCVGSTSAAGISRLMMCEGHLFPDLADFYHREVILPGQELIQRILARGVARGEFKAVDAKYAVHSVIAPMIYLVMCMRSQAGVSDDKFLLVPEDFLAAQIEILLHGLSSPGASPEPAHPSAMPDNKLLSPHR